MKAKDLAAQLMKHPDAEVKIIGDEMSSGDPSSTYYYEKMNLIYVYQD